MRQMRHRGLRFILLLLLGFVLSHTTLAAANDTTPPVFQSLSVAPSTVSAGGVVTVTAHITDDLSGVDSTSHFIGIDFMLLGGTGQTVEGGFTRASGTGIDGV